MFAFTHLGLDHVIANMFYIPMGIFLGTKDLTVSIYIVKGMVSLLWIELLPWSSQIRESSSSEKKCSLIHLCSGIFPVLLGNIVGGGLFVGTYYWWTYLCGSSDLTALETFSDTDSKSPARIGIKRGDDQA